MSIKKNKESSLKKVTASKATVSKVKKVITKKPTSTVRPATKGVSSPAKGKSPAKTISLQNIEDVLSKEALKLVDEAATLIRSGIKNSKKTTSKAREATHKKAHSLLGKATRHLDDAIKSGSSLLRKAINKI
jgi:hypothetical protein